MNNNKLNLWRLFRSLFHYSPFYWQILEQTWLASMSQILCFMRLHNGIEEFL